MTHAHADRRHGLGRGDVVARRKIVAHDRAEMLGDFRRRRIEIEPSAHDQKQ